MLHVYVAHSPSMPSTSTSPTQYEVSIVQAPSQSPTSVSLLSSPVPLGTQSTYP